MTRRELEEFTTRLWRDGCVMTRRELEEFTTRLLFAIAEHKCREERIRNALFGLSLWKLRMLKRLFPELFRTLSEEV